MLKLVVLLLFPHNSVLGTLLGTIVSPQLSSSLPNCCQFPRSDTTASRRLITSCTNIRVRVRVFFFPQFFPLIIAPKASFSSSQQQQHLLSVHKAHSCLPAIVVPDQGICYPTLWDHRKGSVDFLLYRCAFQESLPSFFPWPRNEGLFSGTTMDMSEIAEEAPPEAPSEAPASTIQEVEESEIPQATTSISLPCSSTKLDFSSLFFIQFFRP